MPFLKKSNQKELLDLGPDFYSQEEYRDCLAKLEKIGVWLGGDAASFSAFFSLPFSPLSILDVGCGQGSFTLKLAKRYPKATVLGIDINAQAIEQALANKRAYEKKNATTLSNLNFEAGRLEDYTKKKSRFDVVTSTLVCHHLKEEELIEFLIHAKELSNKIVILNDLQRCATAYFLYWCLSPFFNNRLIRADGLLSIKRSMTKEEWVSVLKKAGIKKDQLSIEKKRGFRFIVKITQ